MAIVVHLMMLLACANRLLPQSIPAKPYLTFEVISDNSTLIRCLPYNINIIKVEFFKNGKLFHCGKKVNQTNNREEMRALERKDIHKVVVRRHLNETIDYSIDHQSKADFTKGIQSYWPKLDPSRLLPDYAGLRIKVRPFEHSESDFTLLGPQEHGVEGLVHLLGIESPGLTSALAIAEWVEHALN